MRLQCRILSGLLKRYLSKNPYALHKLRDLKFYSTIEDVCKTDLVFHIDQQTLLSCHISPQGNNLYYMEAHIERDDFKIYVAGDKDLTEDDVFDILYWVKPLEVKTFPESETTYLMIFIQTLLSEGYTLKDMGNNHYRLQNITIPGSEIYTIRSNGLDVVDIVSISPDNQYKGIESRSLKISLQSFLEIMSGLMSQRSW